MHKLTALIQSAPDWFKSQAKATRIASYVTLATALYALLSPSLWWVVDAYNLSRSLQYGNASYYDPDYDGRRTASGIIFKHTKPMAAHPDLPFGTYVLVQRLDNSASTIVQIQDRGPFISGRVIDLSISSARKIGLVKSGVAPVRLVVLPDIKGFDIK